MLGAIRQAVHQAQGGAQIHRGQERLEPGVLAPADAIAEAGSDAAPRVLEEEHIQVVVAANRGGEGFDARSVFGRAHGLESTCGITPALVQS